MKTTNAVSTFARVLAAIFTFGTLLAYVGWKHRELSGVTAGFDGVVPVATSMVTADSATPPPDGLPPAPSIGSAESQVLPHPQLTLGSTKSATFFVPPKSVEALMAPFPDVSIVVGTTSVPDLGSPPIAVGTTVQPPSLHLMGTKSGAVSLSVPAPNPSLHMGSTKVAVGVISPRLLQTVVDPATTDKNDKHAELVSRLFKEGLGYFDLGQFENACASFNKILALDPHNVAARRQLERAEDVIENYFVSTRTQTPKVQPPALHLGSTKSLDSILSSQSFQSVGDSTPNPFASPQTTAPLTMPSTKSLQISPFPVPDPFGAPPTEPAKQAK